MSKEEKQEEQQCTEKKNTIIDWIVSNRRKLIIAGISITAIVLFIVGLKNQEELERAFDSLKKLVEKKTIQSVPLENERDTTSANIPKICEVIENKAVDDNCAPISRAPHSVIGHPRNLHEGWKASEAQIKSAAENGITLMEGQTWVNSYKTGMDVAC